MTKIWKRVLAGAMALTILGGVSQVPTAYATENVPPAGQTVPGEVKRDFTVPNSINVLKTGCS